MKSQKTHLKRSSFIYQNYNLKFKMITSSLPGNSVAGKKVREAVNVLFDGFN